MSFKYIIRRKFQQKRTEFGRFRVKEPPSFRTVSDEQRYYLLSYDASHSPLAAINPFGSRAYSNVRQKRRVGERFFQARTGKCTPCGGATIPMLSACAIRVAQLRTLFAVRQHPSCDTPPARAGWCGRCCNGNFFFGFFCLLSPKKVRRSRPAFLGLSSLFGDWVCQASSGIFVVVVAKGRLV